MDYYRGNIPIIDDTPEGRAYAFPGKIDGVTVGHGYVPRDYNVYPEEMFAAPSELQLIPESEYDARYDEQESQQSSLEHVYLRGGQPAFVNLDQNGDGHCWAYSTGQSAMIERLSRAGSTPRLNPHSVATCLRQFQGGWCGMSAKFYREVGCALEGTGPNEWPLHSNNTSLDTPAMREAMKANRILEDYVDLTRPVYSQNLTMPALATLGFLNIPCPTDYNWWSHSVCRIRWVRIEAGSWGALILNSWKGWGRFGLGVLRGSQATANGAVATRVTGYAA